MGMDARVTEAELRPGGRQMGTDARVTVRDRSGVLSSSACAWTRQCEAQSVPVPEPKPAAQLRLRRGDAILAASVLLPAGALAAILVP